MGRSTLLLLVSLSMGMLRSDLQGQSVRVDPVQSLQFGTLIAGVPETVLRTDPVRAARLDLERRGGRGGRILTWFLLPSQLTGPGGASIPLRFEAGSAGYSTSGDIGSQVGFNPAGFSLLALPADGTASIFLGGTADTPLQATPGRYTATISMTLFHLGF